MRFLDLDPIKQPGGEVRINGKTYQVWPIQVKTVVNLNAPAEGNGAGTTFAEQLQQTVGVLRQLIPDVPEAELHDLTLEQLNTLLTWAREVAYGVAEKNSAEPAPEAAPALAPAPETVPPETALAATTASTSPA